MSKIRLSDFTGVDDLAKFRRVLDYMKANPGTTLFVDPGEYIITTELARAAQANVMNGKWGKNPEPVMFAIDYEYDRGLDFAGHKGSRIEAYGVTLMVDGFMEPVSVRDCADVEICGLTVDHLRKPFSRGDIIGFEERDGDKLATVEFGEMFPITENMAMPVGMVYDPVESRLVRRMQVDMAEYIDEHHAKIKCSCTGEWDIGRELILRHTQHARPSILIHNAVNTVLRDVTIHSATGMGITAQQSTDILIERLRVVPSVGEHYSTNTDATHFASCRGKLCLDGCQFEGHGDDAINVHTYYYVVEEYEGTRARLVIKSIDGPHARLLDYPLVGDTMELTEISTLNPIDTYRVISVEPDFENFCCTVELDRPLPESMDGLFLADADELPELEFVNCHARSHIARSILIKCRKALVENCVVYDAFEDAVKIAAEAYWHEGVSSADVTVRRCRFVNCARESHHCGGIHVYMDCSDRTALSHGLVTIEDNIIDCPDADHAIIVENARQAKLRRNQVRSGDEPIVIGDGVELI